MIVPRTPPYNHITMSMSPCQTCHACPIEYKLEYSLVLRITGGNLISFCAMSCHHLSTSSAVSYLISTGPCDTNWDSPGRPPLFLLAIALPSSWTKPGILSLSLTSRPTPLFRRATRFLLVLSAPRRPLFPLPLWCRTPASRRAPGSRPRTGRERIVGIAITSFSGSG
jgi:hypothetical protein